MSFRNRLGALAWLALALLAITQAARAHRLDEYLQATLVDMETNSVSLHIKLTPGVAVADAVIGLIDADHDGQISTSEADAYAAHVRSELSLELDGHPLVLQVAVIRVPPLAELRAGLGEIHLKLTVAVASIGVGAHELRFQNRHQTNLSVYLVNAVIPQSREIQINAQIRNTNQSESRIQFTRAGTAVFPAFGPGTTPHRIGPRQVLGYTVVVAAMATVVWAGRRRGARS